MVTWYSQVIAIVLYVGTCFGAYQMGVLMERARTVDTKGVLLKCDLNT
ncbi:MAG: hypothetical protein RI911_651 [Candidatus Parcubacteria bacterium]|jgi:hypothetical protein